MRSQGGYYLKNAQLKPMSTSKAIGLVEQVIEEGQQIYRKDVLAALSMSLDALRAIEMAEAIESAGDDLYLCDPDKNTECTKEGCYVNGGPCYLTKDERFRDEWPGGLLWGEDK